MERSPLVLQGQAGWGDSALGPSPLLRGWELWELGWFPAQLKGQERPVSYKAWEAVPVFFQIPLMMGNVSLKDSCHSERGDFPPSQGRMACLLGAQAQWGGGGVREQSQCSEESHDGNQETHMFSFLVALSSPGLSFPI